MCLCLLLLPLPTPFSWPVLIANAALLQAWIPWDHYFFSYDYASWSISTELFFYAIFPLLMATGKRAVLFILLLSILLVALLVEVSSVTDLPSWAPSGQQLSSTGLLYGFPLARMSEFVLGVVCGLDFRAREQATRPAVPSLRWTLYECAALVALALAFAACRFGLAPCLHRAMLALHFTNLPLVAPVQEATTLGAISPLAGLITREWADHVCLAPFAAGLIVVFSRQRGWITAGLSNRYLVFGGEISFALYLLHQLVLRLMQEHRMQFDGSGFALYLRSIGIGAAILHLTVEQPARRWLIGRKIPFRYC
ncbi:acyltransferase family protein [Actimicrobium sp. CCC2.4]|uniref:acyltransferase family protein n=1 Tax=Actimicrobium sp. CCC2.4 TaxID=3048606 RepID=UPI002B255879|nr:acyltransferase family protein [Actimicrobium sp. CCC2.4]